MKITRKLFLTLLSLVSLVIVINFVLARWSFQQGFLDFIHGMEQKRLEQVVIALAQRHREAGYSWRGFQRPEFVALVRQNAILHPTPHHIRNHRPLPPGPRGPNRPIREGDAAPHLTRANSDLPRSHPPGNRTGPVTALYDITGHLVVATGEVPNDTERRGVITIPVRSEQQLIGELRSWPQAPNENQQASDFARQQRQYSIAIAIGCLLLAGVVCWFVTTRLLKPVRPIIASVSELTKGNYQLDLQPQSNDELGQLMEDIRHLSTALDKNRSAKNRWFADISHELRTPLTVLMGEIEVMNAGLRPFDKSQLASLEQEINLLSRLVDDLYQLSLSDLGALRYHFEPMSIAQSVVVALDGLENQLHNAGLQVVANLQQSGKINGDPSRLNQLWLNLLTNAIHYTDSPGTVAVTSTLNGDWVCLEVEDSAPGVSEEALPWLFDALYRHDASRQRRRCGAGLGLAICQNIVDAHQGIISASSSPLGGVKITVQLPLLKEE